VILAGRRINDNMARYAARSVIKRMLQNGIDVARSTVGVLGVTFKDNCPDIRNSKVADLVREFQNWNVKVVVTDPWADAQEVRREYGIELAGLDACTGQLDSLVVAVAHNQFAALQPSDLRALCRPAGQPVIGDLKSMYDRHRLAEAGFTVFRL
jgi:UDP-N-acetyl-D-galactosamine dehydrogenase